MKRAFQIFACRRVSRQALSSRSREPCRTHLGRRMLRPLASPGLNTSIVDQLSDDRLDAVERSDRQQVARARPISVARAAVSRCPRRRGATIAPVRTCRARSRRRSATWPNGCLAEIHPSGARVHRVRAGARGRPIPALLQRPAHAQVAHQPRAKSGTQLEGADLDRGIGIDGHRCRVRRSRCGSGLGRFGGGAISAWAASMSIHIGSQMWPSGSSKLRPYMKP